MKKIKKLLLGCALPLAALTIATPIIATSCSVTPATIVKSEWKSYLNDEPGFTLNSTKEELIYDLNTTNVKKMTLGKIEEQFIYGKKGTESNSEIDRNTVGDFIKTNIVNFNSDKFNIKVDDVQKDLNNRIAIFKFLLTSKDGLEISNLIFTVKNYSIPGTWLKTAIMKDFTNHLSNDAMDLNVDISKVPSNSTWYGLHSEMNKQAVIGTIVESTSNNDLKQEFKNLIDENTQYNFSVTNNSDSDILTFTITLTEKTPSSGLKNKESGKEDVQLKLIVTNNKTGGWS